MIRINPLPLVHRCDNVTVLAARNKNSFSGCSASFGMELGGGWDGDHLKDRTRKAYWKYLDQLRAAISIDELVENSVRYLEVIDKTRVFNPREKERIYKDVDALTQKWLEDNDDASLY